MTGTIPSSLGSLTSLQEFNVYNTLLYGRLLCMKTLKWPRVFIITAEIQELSPLPWDQYHCCYL